MLFHRMMGFRVPLGQLFAPNIETAFTCALVSVGTELKFLIAGDMVPHFAFLAKYSNF